MVLRSDTERPSRLLRWSPAVLWMAVVFALSSVSDPGVPSWLTSPGHATMFAILGATYVWALDGHIDPPRLLAVAVLLASAYGVTDEFHQSFVPGRVPDVLDWAWDTVGAAIGAASAILILRVLARRSSRGRFARPKDSA